jgi:uncharacterized protein YjbI with pentapeptide repeats
MRLRTVTAALLLLPGAALALAAGAADFSARDLTRALYGAPEGARINLSGKSLRELDLAGVDFKAARLTKADLYGANLAEANLSGTDLADARLDRAVLTRSDFSGANLAGATLLRPTIFSGLERNIAEAPRFTGANMAHTGLTGWLDGTDFSNADLTGAVFGRQDALSEGLLASRVRMTSCNFTGAKLAGASFRGAQLVFARFTGADATGADFRGADLTKADFSGADVAGMDVTGAILDGASFTGAKNLDAIQGLVHAQGADRIGP